MGNFGEIGSNVEIFEPVTFLNKQKIFIKEKVRFSEYALVAGGEGTYIGNFIHVANHVSIIGGGICILEDFVGLCAGSRIITGSDDISGNGIPTPLVSSEFRSFYRSYVVCKRHSFIGTNAVIQPGVIIGEGAVVASGSVVTKDLEPWHVYAGTPAKKVKERKQETILKMTDEIYKKYGIIPANFNDIIEVNKIGLK